MFLAVEPDAAKPASTFRAASCCRPNLLYFGTHGCLRNLLDELAYVLFDLATLQVRVERAAVEGPNDFRHVLFQLGGDFGLLKFPAGFLPADVATAVGRTSANTGAPCQPRLQSGSKGCSGGQGSY
jgi:hypothetical protein